MKFDRKDLNHAKNMLKALGKGEWKLDGMEILAFNDMMRWFATLQQKMESEIVADEALVSAKPKDDQIVIKQESNVIKSEPKTSRSKKDK